MKPITRSVGDVHWALVSIETGEALCAGQEYVNHRGETETLLGGGRPPSSTGFVQTSAGEFYAHCANAKWVVSLRGA
jgi:hypothetical protein